MVLVMKKTGGGLLRPQHQTRSRVYGTLTRDKKITIINYLADQVEQGRLNRSQFESIKRYIIRSDYANNILNVVPQAEGLLTKPGVANNKQNLGHKFNKANYENIAGRFRRGNVNSPKIPLETDADWEKFVNGLVEELGAIRVNNNLAEEVPTAVSTTVRAVEKVLGTPFGRQLTFSANAMGGTRKRRCGSKRRRTVRRN
jgi:hypothetical protein